MNERFRNRFLVWALGISLVVHAAFATVVHRIPPAEAQPEPPARISIVHIVIPPPTPTPKPVLHPHRQPSQHPAHNQTTHVAVAPQHVESHANSGESQAIAAGTPGPEQTGEPGPTASPATPAPACSQPYVAAHTIEAINPSAPDDAAGMTGTAEVQVSLNAAGRVTDVRIFHSTGSMGLDRVALDAARRSTYAPQIVDCQPAGGTYLFRVDFQD